VSQKTSPFYFWNNSVKNKAISIFLVDKLLRKLDTIANYKFAHFTLKMSPHYLVKCKKSICDSSWLRHGVSSSRAWWIIDQWRTRLKLVFRQTAVISNSACDVVCGTIFHTIQQPVLFRATQKPALFTATHFFPKKTVD